MNGRRRAVIAAVPLILGSGCSSDTTHLPAAPKRDVAAAQRFAAFPLYWAGPRFEKWDLAAVQGLHAPRSYVSFIYGRCTPSNGEQPSCAPPFEIKIAPLCSHLDVVAADTSWRTHRVRGAPVGRNPDGAPILFSRRVQVTVYRGQGSDPGLPLRVLRSLRSLNRVPPVVRSADAIPGPAPRVLARTRACD